MPERLNDQQASSEERLNAAFASPTYLPARGFSRGRSPLGPFAGGKSHSESVLVGEGHWRSGWPPPTYVDTANLLGYRLCPQVGMAIGSGGPAMKDRTRNGESWEALNKRRGKLAAAARKRNSAWNRRREMEERAERVAASPAAARIRIEEALGVRFHIHVARVVLSALTEPTAGMVEAARTQIDDAGKWRAMVKVALNELD